MAARQRAVTKPPRKKMSEVELCARFIAWAQAGSDWVVYPETGGFDMLLVASDGAQLGLEAKLAFNAKVVEQALPRHCRPGDAGPDYRGVLLPECPRWEAHEQLRSLGLLGFWGSRHNDRFHGCSLVNRQGWSDWQTERRIELPAFLPDVPAGAPAPVRLTKWKIAALKITALLEIRGYVAQQDFRDLGIDSRRWTDPAGGLLRREGRNLYVRGEKLRFDQQHPRVYAEIVAATKNALADGAADG